MEQGKISVIVPVYNGAAWIEQCVRSVQAQTWTGWEMLILDDSSLDGTDRIARKLAEEDSRIRFVQRLKKGVSSARNQGIEETDGEFVTFVDADDKLDPRMFEVLADCLEQENSDMAVCGYYRWDGTEEGICGRSGRKTEKRERRTAADFGEKKNVPEGTENPAALGRRTVDRDTYVGEYLLHGYTRCWSVLYRREAVGNVRFCEDLAIGEDMMFLVDLMPRLGRITVTDYRGYFYRVNENGAMLRPFTLSYMDEIKSWRLAAEKIGAAYPEQKARVSSILAVSAMLAAGKLSRLPVRERAKYRAQIAECRETVRQALGVSGAKNELPEGYRVKTWLYTVCPALYLWLYHMWKKE